MKSLFFSLLLVAAVTAPAFAAAEKLPASLGGKNVTDGKSVRVDAEGKRGLVVVFLSAKCPCSNSHVKALKDLSAGYPEFAFVGVHANTDEARAPTEAYFRDAALPFPVVQDTGAKIAEEFRALKTPHAFLLSPAGEVLYKGGVSDSADFSRAKEKYLAAALDDVRARRAVGKTTGRTLGCVIDRGSKNVW